MLSALFTRMIFTKSLRDRWLAPSISAAVLVLFLLYAMAVYRSIDLSIYTDLPESMRELMGIPTGADAASLSYSVMLSFVGGLTIGGIAISMGAASIAGEERGGTLGLLLASPKSRTRVLVAKAAAMVTLTAASVTILTIAGYVIPAMLDVEIGKTHVGAMMLHLGVNGLFYGFMAMALGAWTGRRSAASGISAGVMILSYFAVGLLPLVERLADLAQFFPWYYFVGSEPLVNGVNWGHLGVLGGGCGAFAVLAVVGVNRRDLRGHSVGITLLDRLRDNPATHRLFERLAGSSRVSRLWIKTTSEHQGLLVVTAASMFFIMGLLMGPMYAAIDESIASVADQFPEAVLAIAGGGDMGTPEGFYQIETFSLMAPIAVMLVTIVIGARGLAGEEADNTMGLLLANPIRRSTVVREQALAMTLYAGVIGFSTFAGVALGALASGLDMSLSAIAATSALVTLLGLVFGTLALALGAATGRVKAAVYGTIGAATASHLLNSFLPLNDSLAGYARWTPNHYYLGSDPLMNGMDWSHAALLAGISLVLVTAAAALFERRDLRQH